MSWTLRGYTPGGDDLAAEVDLDAALGELLRRLLDRPADDPLVDSYPLDAGQVRRLAGLLELDVDVDRADWFLDRDADG